MALALGCQLHCLGALNCLHFQQSGHGLIVLACTIQNASQIVSRTDANQSVRSGIGPEIVERGFRLANLTALSLEHRFSEQHAWIFSINLCCALNYFSRFVNSIVKNVYISQRSQRND